MALNSGFERFEGEAYFGYSMEGDGLDAVVIIGQNLIEIRDAHDNPLSQWIPGTYTCNNEDIPYRAYFLGEEWLAPKDEELQAKLDQFQVPHSFTQTSSNRKRSWSPFILFLIVVFILAVMSFFALRPLTKQLLSPAIRESLEEDVLASFEGNYEICNQTLNDSVHDKIISRLDTTDFVVSTNIAQNYARLPTGGLLINAEFMHSLDDVQTLSSLLQLSKISDEKSDPAAEIISKMPLAARFNFLAQAEVSPENLARAWQDYASSELFPQSDYSQLGEPIGNYQNLSTKIGWTEGEYPSTEVDIILTDEEWLSLYSFCEKES